MGRGDFVSGGTELSSSASYAVGDPSAGRGLGRAAGFGYLAIFLTGIPWFGVMQAFRAGGDAALLGHIRQGEALFRLSILSGAATFVAYLVTASLLYRRYRTEAGVAVTLLFAFVVGSVPFSLLAVVRQMELLTLATGERLPPADLLAQTASLMHDWDAVGQLSSLFWGLWLLPLAWLAWRSRGSGRLAGVFVALGGLGYMSVFIKPMVWPGPAGLGPIDLAFAAATVLSEFTITLWLIFASDRPRNPAMALSTQPA